MTPVDRIPAMAWLKSRACICLLLTITICAVYWQTSGFDYVNFDDPRYVYENNTVRQGITFEGMKWAFTTFHASNWHPLTWISHMLDIQFFGVNPGMHHLINVLFHILNTILLFLVLEKMTGSKGKAAGVAALFALHPLHVESVAWMAERKDVLSAFFWMLTTAGYLWYIKQRGIGRYLLVVLFFILGLLSKPMVVTLPFVLLLMDFWPLQRLSIPLIRPGSRSLQGAASGSLPPAGRAGNRGPEIVLSAQEETRVSGLHPGVGVVIAEKVPLIMLSFLSSCITFYAQQKGGAVVTQEALSLGLRAPNVITSYAAYIGKALWPFDLAFFYPFKMITLHEPKFLLSLFIILIITFFALAAFKRFPYLFTGWFWYLGTLVPVIGIVQVGGQSMADRYTYIPLIGIFIMAVWGLSDILNNKSLGRKTLRVISAAVFVILFWLSWMQISTWKDSETLYSHALKVTVNNDMAHNNLGHILFEKGNVDGAIEQYNEVLKINPNFKKVYINLGEAYEKLKDLKTAGAYYFKGIEKEPKNADIHAAYGSLLEKMGRTEDAVSHFHEALKLKPQNIEINTNFGNMMLRQGNNDEALRYYMNALRLDPNQAEVYNNMGTAYIYKDNLKKAMEFYQKAIVLKPDYEDAIKNLGNARTNQIKYQGIISGLEVSIKVDPANPELFTKRGDVLYKLGEYANALDSYQKALKIQPQYIRAMYGISLIYSSDQDYIKALDILQRIKRLQPDKPEVYYNMACIYARQNMVDESTIWLKEAVKRGFKDWNLIRKDPDMTNIRNTAYFKSLIMSHIKS